MKFPKAILILLTAFCFSRPNAQVNLDSLFLVWNDTTQADSSRLEAIYNFSWEGYLTKDIDSASYYVEKMYNHANISNEVKWIGKSLNLKATIQKRKGDYFKALDTYKRSINVFNSINDTLSCAAPYSNLALIFYQNIMDYDSALKYYHKSLYIRLKYKDTIKIKETYATIARINRLFGNLDEALYNYEMGLNFVSAQIDSAMFFRGLGHVYRARGHSLKQYINFKKALQLSKNSKDTTGIIDGYNSLGLLYNNKNELEKSEAYYLEAISLIKNIEHKIDWSPWHYYNNIAVVYTKMKKYDLAYDYCKLALEKLKKHKYNKNSRGYGHVYKTIGNNYKEQKKYNLALNWYLKSKDVREAREDIRELAQIYFHLGKLYYLMKNFNPSINYLDEALTISIDKGYVKLASEISLYKSKSLQKLKKPIEALNMLDFHLILKDSIIKMDGIEKEKQRQFQEQYLLEKQADSIKHADEILIQKAENIAKEEQLNNETQKRNGLIIISLLILVSLALVFIQLKKVRKGKELIEEKQKELTDSINYAKRLQQGILVPFDLVQSWLSETFILFKPKDIVSGDFYWIEKVGNKVYFAVADCTGHGIPGALVSIICSNALTKSLYEDFAYEPSKILDNTRAIVEERFVRAHDKIKDGMDISLCCLNLEEKSINWAGAMNPLWIFRKNSKEVEEFKPDRQSIGMVEKPKRYKQHEIKLAKGDSVYLFSDGYQDQFGGEKGKKYMKGRFKKFILSVQDQDMQTQLASFEKEFNSWKGDYDQIDDVCVMGVRIT